MVVLDAAQLSHATWRVLDGAAAVLLVFLDTALKGALVVAVGGTVATLLRDRSAAIRHSVWVVAVVAHLALPALTLTVPGVRAPWLPLLPTPPWLTADAAPLRFGDGRPSALAALTGLWLAGILVFALRLAVGTWRVSRLARGSARVVDRAWLALTQTVAVRLRLAQPVTLRHGPRFVVPITWGAVYPVVLLPAEADDWPEEQRRLVLVHELAHVRRCDTLTQTAAQVAIALFWFDPLLWLAAWRLRVERERACDDVVLRDGAVPSAYAGALLAVARTLGTGPGRGRTSPAFAALAPTVAPGRDSEFARRVEAILDPARERAAMSRRGVIAAALTASLLTPPLAALRPFRPPKPSPGSSGAAGRAATAPRPPSVP